MKKHLLYIDASAETLENPLIDDLTRKMVAALRNSRKGIEWLGSHICSCGAKSASYDVILSNGTETNTLCVHYLAYHRKEVPPEELNFVRELNSGEQDPNQEELAKPSPKKPKEPSTDEVDIAAFFPGMTITVPGKNKGGKEIEKPISQPPEELSIDKSDMIAGFFPGMTITVPGKNKGEERQVKSITDELDMAAFFPGMNVERRK